MGFPGETDTEFEELLQWLAAAQLDRVGCFKYSPVQGAAANAIAAHVPAEVKEERYARSMECAARISAPRLQRRVGQRLRVLVDSVDEQGAVARSEAEAPEIDGVVRITGATGLAPGQWTDVQIRAADTYDLHARTVAR